MECSKWKYGNFNNNYRVATLSKSYLTIIGIDIMQSLKSLGQFMIRLTIRYIRYGRTHRP